MRVFFMSNECVSNYQLFTRKRLFCLFLINWHEFLNFFRVSRDHESGGLWSCTHILYMRCKVYCLTKLIALFRSNKQCYDFIYVYSMNILSMNLKECKIILLCKTYDIRPPGFWTTPVVSGHPERFRRFGTAEGRVWYECVLVFLCFCH